MNIVLSCEHGGNHIPDDYQHLFVGAEEVLNTHRGYDIGALELFEAFQELEVNYAKSNTVSRLLVDVNRSLYRQTLFSEYTKGMFKGQKQKLLNDYYYAYRHPFEEVIRQLWQKQEQVLHLSIHSFTPVLNGETRGCDIGLLYHPQRKHEKELCQKWKRALKAGMPQLRLRFNYPYSGKPDGHVRYFRDREVEQYMGVEVELNQKHAGNTEINKGIVDAFKQSISES